MKNLALCAFVSFLFSLVLGGCGKPEVTVEQPVVHLNVPVEQIELQLEVLNEQELQLLLEQLMQLEAKIVEQQQKHGNNGNHFGHDKCGD